MKKLIISSVLVGVLYAGLLSLHLFISGVAEAWSASFFEGVVLGAFWYMLDLPKALCGYKSFSPRYFLALLIILTTSIGTLLLMPSWWGEDYKAHNSSLGWAVVGFVVTASLIFGVKSLYKRTTAPEQTAR